MNVAPMISVWSDPPVQETGTSYPTILSGGSDIFLAYNSHNPAFPGWDSGASPDHPGFISKVAVVRFEMVRIFKLGYPNSEAISGHPLYRFGLTHYDFHIVKDSPWIAELCVQNEVHPLHNKSFWENLKHWIVTFEDETLEVIGENAAISIHDSISITNALLKVSAQSDNA